MKKILFAVVASLAALVATSTGAQATFTVTVTGGGIGQTIVANDAFPPTTAGAQYISLLTGTGISGSISSSATETFPKISELNSTFSLLNNTGVAISGVTITITQNAFTFPTIPIFYKNATRVSLRSPTDVTVTLSATNQLTQITNYVASGSTTTQLAAIGGSGPYSITQTFVINNLADGGSISVSADTSIFTPLPATALMAGLGFPLLGLAGAARRRLFA